jgi:hypothetical protein
MCKKCNDDRCIGMYLLHQKELCDRYKLMKKELLENKNRSFILINSPSSGEIFTKFYELHVLDNVDDAEAGNFVDKRHERKYTTNVSNLVDVKDEILESFNKPSTIIGTLNKLRDLSISEQNQ